MLPVYFSILLSFLIPLALTFRNHYGLRLRLQRRSGNLRPSPFSEAHRPVQALIRGGLLLDSHVSSHSDYIVTLAIADLTNRADATIAAQATGAMSWAFITALKKNPQQSYVQLLNSIRDELASKYSQRPQLSSSHPLSE